MDTDTMDTVGILSLPNELLLKISGYLSMSDILSCSITCHRLRSTLNVNYVWKRFLHSEDSSVFEEKELPTIDIPQQEELSPLCSNRLHVIRKVKILNNWTHGRCSYEVIQEGYGNEAEGERRLTSDLSMYSDSFVFLLAKFENFSFVELWNIRGKPYRLTYVKYQSVDMVQVVEDNLVVFDTCKTYVHGICVKDNDLPLKYVLHVNDEDLCLSSLGNKCSHKNKESQLWDRNAYKQFLIYNYKNKLFIWDFKKSKKVITYNFPHVYRIFVAVDFSYGSYVLLKLYSDIGCSEYRIINIFKNQSFNLTPLYIVYDHIVLQDTYFVAFEFYKPRELTCSVYDIKTNQLMSEKLFKGVNRGHNGFYAKIVNGCFALLSIDSTLTLYDGKTLDIIHTIECNPYIGSVHFFDFNVLSKLFLGAINSRNFSIWNVERKVLLPSLPSFDNMDFLISFNKWCSKVVCCDHETGTISVLNFSK